MVHCRHWEHDTDGNNCDTNTDTVADYLAEKQVETSVPLYLAAEIAKVEQDRLSQVLHALKTKGYKVS